MGDKILEEREAAVDSTGYAAEESPCPSCVHDYSEPCPQGWVRSSADVCVAPNRYRGPFSCVGNVFFNALAPSEKAEVERRCVFLFSAVGGNILFQGVLFVGR